MIVMKAVISNWIPEDAIQYLKEAHFEVFVADSNEPLTYLSELKTADAYINRLGLCDASIIEQCKKLKVIGRTGVGFDNIDIACATRHRIPVVVTPGTNSRAVAEHTLALLLACAKRLKDMDQGVRQGNWPIRDAEPPTELEGKTVGIIGTGAIGKIVAQLCRALGMECLGYSHSHNRAKVEQAGCVFAESLPELLKKSDFVTLHVPLLATTQHMISLPELQMMKPTAFLINTSRGEIVNEADLAKALQEGIIAGAGVDVFSQEPVPPEQPLLQAPHLIMTPHCAALTPESMGASCLACAKGCVAVCRGEKWPQVVNPEVYGK